MDDLVVDGLTIPASDLDEEFTTSGGPGGQHANRNETAVRLRLDLRTASLPEDARSTLIGRLGDVVEVNAAEERSQLRNRERARERMTEMLEAALTTPKARKQTKPTSASKRKRKADKKARSELKKTRRQPTLDD